MAPSTQVSKFLVAHAVVKTCAIIVGFAGTVLSLMALAGLVTGITWVRVSVAVVAAVVIPLVVIDRALPADNPQSAKGLPTDILALAWLGFAFAFTVPGNPVTQQMLTVEADRLQTSGMTATAGLTYFLAGVETGRGPSPNGKPIAGASASASASGSAAAPKPTGKPSATAPAASTSAAPVDAGSQPKKKPKRSPGDMTPAELFEKLSPAVVTVSVKKQAGPLPFQIQGGGTGFLIDEQGTIATNHHVISGGTALQIKFINGAVFTDVELLVENSGLDLALLRVDLANPADAGPAVDAKPMTLGDSEEVKVGERAIAIGNPLGLEHTLTDGLVSSRRLYEGRQWIQISVPVSPGNSGGPLLNMRGEVIGVVTAQIAGGRAQNLNLAVPVKQLRGMIQSSYPQRRKFGDGSGPTRW